MKNPPLNKYVLGFFKSTVRFVPYHVCDCYFDGTNWKTMGNDRVEDLYGNPPYAWTELPQLPEEEEQSETDYEVDNRLLKDIVFAALGQPFNYEVTKVSDYGWHSWSILYEDCTVSCEEGKVFIYLEPNEREKLIGLTRDKLSRRLFTIFPSRGYTNETKDEYYDLDSAKQKLIKELSLFKRYMRR